MNVILSCILALTAGAIAVVTAKRRTAPILLVEAYWGLVTLYWILRAIG